MHARFLLLEKEGEAVPREEEARTYRESQRGTAKGYRVVCCATKAMPAFEIRRDFNTLVSLLRQNVGEGNRQGGRAGGRGIWQHWRSDSDFQ